VNLGAITAELWQERPDLRDRVGREWTKQHYQRHEKAVTDRFLKEAVDVLRQRMDMGGYRHLILVGNSVTLARVEAMLPKALREVVVKSLVMERKGRVQEVVEATLSAFVEAEERESLTMVEQLEHHLYKTGLAVAGSEASLHALRNGAADVLVLSTRLDESEREEMVRLAERTAAQIELVDESAALERWGGVGCLLRYRPSDLAQALDEDGSPAESKSA
jgi:stalled ribosome rescue protein Dom34